MGTSEVTSNIAGVAGAAEETGAAASRVLRAAAELTGQSEHLSAQVERFLTEVQAAWVRHRHYGLMSLRHWGYRALVLHLPLGPDRDRRNGHSNATHFTASIQSVVAAGLAEARLAVTLCVLPSLKHPPAMLRQQSA
jgi:hypothetical protein